MLTTTILGAVALMFTAAPVQDAPAQNAPVLSIEDSLTCAGLFFAQSQLPENEKIPGAVDNYRQITKVFLDRAAILAERQGLSTDSHIETAASVTDFLLGEVNAKTDQIERYQVIAGWQGAEDECVAGGVSAP